MRRSWGSWTDPTPNWNLARPRLPEAGLYANICSYGDAMSKGARSPRAGASMRPTGGRLGDRHGVAVLAFGLRLGGFGSHEMKPARRERALWAEGPERKRFAHECLDANALGRGELPQQAVLGAREANRDSS